jgi:hypothetical protein
MLQDHPQIQDSMNLADYMMTDTRHPRVEALSQNQQPPQYSPSNSGQDSVSPFSPEYNLPFHSSPQDSMHPFNGSFDGPLESPVDRKPSAGFGTRGSISDMSVMGGSIMMPVHRTSVGSVGTQGYLNRNGSIDGSEALSPTSSRGQGGRNSDENVSYQGGNNENTNSGNGGGKENQKQEDSSKPPAWSELKTKAGKERKRLPLACIACRRKKIRCSGEKPACKHCLRSRIPCVYKVTTRKAAPRTDYMAMLDKRLKRMEDRVIKIIPKEDMDNMANIARAVVKPALPGQLSKTPLKSPNKKRSADEAFIVEINNWNSSKNKNNQGDGNQKSRAQKRDAPESSLQTEGAEFLPSMELQEHLAEVFFDCVYGQSYLLLHKPSFIRKLKAGLLPPVLILAVCAISGRFSTHPEVSTEPAFLRGEEWAKPARDISMKRHAQPSITILIVYLILGLHEFGTCNGGASWSFGGQALRMAYALQLHRELDQDPLGRKQDKNAELSFTDREIRRRTMWACYLMDRFNSSGTERPPIGNEEFIDIQLPIKESYFQMEIPGPTENLEGEVPNPISPGNGQVSDPKSNMGVAAYVIRGIVIWGKIVKYFNLGGKKRDRYPSWDPKSGYMDLKGQIERYKESFPSSLAFTTENLQVHASEKHANQFIFLHVIYHQLVLFLNRWAIPSSPGSRPPRDVPPAWLKDSGQAAIEAANKVSLLIHQASGHSLTVPFAGYCAFTASTVQIWGIFSQNSQLEAASKVNLGYCYKFLNKMKKHWGVFQFMTVNIKNIYRQFADAALKGTTASSSTPGSPILQYGDWFDKYPHGVSRTDYEDPDSEVKQEPGSEAVLSQKPDLQSVEEFFASLSPPSQAERSRKVARRHGKTASENLKPAPKHNPDAKFDPQMRQTANVPILPDHSLDTDNQALVAPQQMQFQPQNTFDPSMSYQDYGIYANQLPQLDRQLVFGAYAGVDPSTATNAVNGLNNNLWDGLDMNGLGTGFFNNEPTSAWFMPFNMDVPWDTGALDDGMGTWTGGGMGNQNHNSYGMGYQGEPRQSMQTVDMPDLPTMDLPVVSPEGQNNNG